MASGPLVLPLVETIDRTGDSFNKGLGGAPVSSTAAAIQGAIQGLGTGAELASKILDTRRQNDPRRVEAELVGMELRNEAQQEAVRGAQLRNDLTERTSDITVAQAEANLDSTRTRTDIIARQNTPERLALQDSAARSRIASQSEARRVSQLRNTAQDQTLRTRRDELQNAILEERLAVIAETNMGGQAPDGTARQNFEFGSEQIRKNAKTISDLSEARSEIRNNPGLQQALDSQITRLEQQQEQLTEDLLTNQTSRRIAASQEAADQIASDNADVALTNRQTATRTRRNIVANDALQSAVNGASDIDAVGVPNYRAGLISMAKLSELARRADNPNERSTRERQIVAAIKEFGGADAIKSYIDEQVEDPEEQKGLRRALSQAAVASGNLDILPSDQQNIIKSGLGIENAADPDKAKATAIQAMQSGMSDIEDPEFKQAMRGSLYFAAANDISQGGQLPFKVNTVPAPAPQGEPGADLTNVAQPAEVAVVFSNEQGQSKSYRLPADETEQAQLSFMEDVSRSLNTDIQSKQQVQATSQAIERNNQEGPALPTQQPEAEAPAAQQATPQQEQASEVGNMVLSRLQSEGAEQASPELVRFTEELSKGIEDGNLDSTFLGFGGDQGVVRSAAEAMLNQTIEGLSPAARAEFEDPSRGSLNRARLLEEAENSIREAAADGINMARFNNSRRRRELEAQQAGARSLTDRLSARLELEAFDRQGLGTLNAAQERALRERHQLSVQQFTTTVGRPPSEAELQELLFADMRTTLGTGI